MNETHMICGRRQRMLGPYGEPSRCGIKHEIGKSNNLAINVIFR